MLMRRFATLGMALPLLAGSYALAEDPAMHTNDQRTNDVRAADAPRNERDQMETKRLSKIIGSNVYNSEGKKLGSIDDIVLQENNNRISYAVLSSGGVMGVGNKLFAVSWNALEHKSVDDKTYLNATEQDLNNAKGFDKDHWPNAGDPMFQRADANRNDLGNAAGEIKNDADIKADTNNAAGPMDRGIAWNRRVSKLIGADVRNASNENLGDIKDIVANTRSGQLNYAVLSYGGVMGIGDKLFAVPIGVLHSQADNQKLVLDVTKDRLKNAPGFNKDHWPDFADQTFRSNVDDFYNQRNEAGNTAKTE